jgi:hypothetical protein
MLILILPNMLLSPGKVDAGAAPFAPCFSARFGWDPPPSDYFAPTHDACVSIHTTPYHQLVITVSGFVPPFYPDAHSLNFRNIMVFFYYLGDSEKAILQQPNTVQSFSYVQGDNPLYIYLYSKHAAGAPCYDSIQLILVGVGNNPIRSSEYSLALGESIPIHSPRNYMINFDNPQCIGLANLRNIWAGFPIYYHH